MTPPVARLSARFDPRRNAFDVLRLVFAAGVAVTHGMTVYSGRQPYLGNTDLGDLGLDGFFILSGFLVTRSYLRLGSPPRFVWHRFLRIMPGFWTCLLVVAFVIAPLAAVLRGWPVTTPFTVAPTALRFVAVDAGLLMVQFDVSGVFTGSPAEGHSVDGALWTLFFEASCYAAVLAAGLTAVLHRRRWVVLLVAAALAVLVALQEDAVAVPVNRLVLRLGFVFVLGVVAHLFADRIPMRRSLAAAAVAVLMVSLLALPAYRALGGVAWAYLVLWVGTWHRISWSMEHDLSYGLYIYHWPVFHLLYLTPVVVLPQPAFLVLGIAVTVPFAAASWFLVERRALSYRNVALRAGRAVRR